MDKANGKLGIKVEVDKAALEQLNKLTENYKELIYLHNRIELTGDKDIEESIKAVIDNIKNMIIFTVKTSIMIEVNK